jgi:hypothetical protein
MTNSICQNKFLQIFYFRTIIPFFFAELCHPLLSISLSNLNSDSSASGPAGGNIDLLLEIQYQ